MADIKSLGDPSASQEWLINKLQSAYNLTGTLNDDMVNHPSHYTQGKYECIDVIFDILNTHDDPVSAWLTGQIIKYIWRWPHKNGLEDLKKTQFYLNKLIEREEQKASDS